ncbi:hypothetical protein MKY29_18535 [Psychrobacillus sp. FSL K6-2365]|uniref:hypothetical protein n=1 Tax=Psychrobacillus sp. FSL K6-2365 TaxID=2921546 RepID=UPI0030FC2057
MDNYSTIRELLKRISGQDNTFTIPKIYVEYTGDLTTAVLLNQIVFYSDKSKRTDGFFYKSYQEWEKEVCLSEKQVRRSTNKLKDFGVVETKLLKANGAPTLHYKLDYDRLAESILTFCQNPSLPIVRNDSDVLSETLTENTTENTTENKDNSRKQVYDENSIYFQLSNRLYQKILSHHPAFKKPNLQKWSNEMRLMMERDERTEKQIIYVIDWCQDNNFWKTIILSISKLRNKFDQLVIQIKAEHKKNEPVKKPEYGEVNTHEGRNEKHSTTSGDVQLFR